MSPLDIAGHVLLAPSPAISLYMCSCFLFFLSFMKSSFSITVDMKDGEGQEHVLLPASPAEGVQCWS